MTTSNANTRVSGSRCACLRPSIADARPGGDIRRTSFPEHTNDHGEAGACVLATPTGRPARPGCVSHRPPGNPGGPAMITLTGHGRLTRDVQTRTTHSGKTVATISVASDRRDRDAQPVYVDLIVCQAQATAAAEHLVKGQAVSFSGRFEPHEYVSASGEQRVALELHGV